MSKSNLPFHCMVCRLSKIQDQDKQLQQLTASLDNLTSQLSSISGEIKDLKICSTPAANTSQSTTKSTQFQSHITVPSVSPALSSPSSARPAISPLSSDTKFNLVFYGISESPQGTPYTERLDKDFQEVNTIISSLNSTLLSSVRDCSRLGKYNSSTTRPLLVKFNSRQSIHSILKLSSQLPTGVNVKHQLSFHDRQINSVLLKERYRLVSQEGIDKSTITSRKNQ